MKNIWIYTIFIALVFVFFSSAVTAQEESKIRIIANKDVKAEEVDSKFIQKLFLGKTKKWPDGSKAVAVVFKDDSFSKEFIEKFVGKSLSKFRNHWKKLIFTGRGIPPKEFKDAEKVIEFVKNNSGSISYVPATASSDEVKTLNVK